MMFNLFKFVGHKYKNKNGKIPFEVFLKYSNEKQKGSDIVAKILKNIGLREKIEFLDIGTGNGEFLIYSLKKARLDSVSHLELIEPSKDLRRRLKENISTLSLPYTIDSSAWLAYHSQKRFDIILASHLYHIPISRYVSELSKMVAYLNSGGSLIFILREEDDFYNFKMNFEPRFFGQNFRARTISDAIDTFKRISNDVPLNITRYTSTSELKIPLKSNYEDAIAIIEFCLDQRWDKIPQNMQKEIISYLEKKSCRLKLKDGMVVIRKI